MLVSIKAVGYLFPTHKYPKKDTNVKKNMFRKS